MSQHDYIIDDALTPDFRADLNLALAAIVTQNSDPTEPVVTYPNMYWYDTSVDTVKVRNESNSGWISLMVINQTTNSLSFTSGDVGIGNTTPTTKLDVSGTVNATALSIGGTVLTPTAAELNYVDGVTSAIQTQLDAKISSSSPALTGNVTVTTNSTSPAMKITQTGTGAAFLVEDSASTDNSPFIIDTSGNVGVGTGSPISTQGTALNVYNAQNTGTVDSNAAIVVESVNRNASFQTRVSTTGTSNFFTYNTDGIALYGGMTVVGNSGAPYTAFYADGSERVRIEANGEVGIGTISPAYKLDVNGTANATTLSIAGTAITATAAELNFVDGVTSLIQTQLDGKAPLTGTGTSGTWPISISGDAATTDGKSFGTFTAAGGIAYATSTTALAAIGAGTAGQALLSGGSGAPTWGSAKSHTLLGTVATTSGTSVSLSSLDLTPYTTLQIVMNNISGTTTGSFIRFNGPLIFGYLTGTSSTIAAFGICNLNLSTGIYASPSASNSASGVFIGASTITTATTTLTFTPSAGSFDAGSLLIYGIA